MFRHSTCKLSSGCFIAFSIVLRGYLAFASVKKPPKKEKRSCPISSSKPGAKKKSKSEFDKESAGKLAESDKGSFYQQEKWPEELESENPAVTESASCSKIQLEEPNEESQLSSSTPSADGTWKTISGRAIVSSEKLLQSFLVSLAWRRSTKMPGRIIQKRSKERQNVCSRKN